MNYDEFKKILYMYFNDIKDKDITKLWNVYCDYYFEFGETTDYFLDSLLFLHKKDNSLTEDEFINLLSILICTKKEIYMSNNKNINYTIYFPNTISELDNKKNYDICTEYLNHLQKQEISDDEKILFSYSYYLYKTSKLQMNLTREELINMVNLNFYLQSNFDMYVYTETIINSIIRCFSENPDLSYIGKYHWCYGNVITMYQNNFVQIANIIKMLIAEKKMALKEMDKYFILGLLSNGNKSEKLNFSNENIIKGQNYYLSSGDVMDDIAQSIDDYLHDEMYQKKETDFIIGIIKKGLALEEEKKLIKN